MLPESDAYKLLQVDQGADPAVVHAAYLALARRFHPDGREPDPSRMSLLNRAYARLRDPVARRRYDLERARRATSAVHLVPPPTRGVSSNGKVAAGPGPEVLDFGRYSGWRLMELARHDPDYLRWLARHSSGLRFREPIARLLPNEPDLERRANSVA
jgi:curved DNA-binding protein CbpA